MEPVYRGLEIAAHSIVAAQGMKLSVEGVENIPATGGAVLAINHTSYVDFLPAALGVYRGGRRTRYMIKAEMMNNPFVRFLITNTHTVPVDRSAGAQAYETAVSHLREGYIIGVYPEATISRSFELKEFKTGAVRMAREADVPIIPAIVWGAQRQWSKGTARDMGRSHIPVSVRFGVPMRVSIDGEVAEQTADLKSVMSQLLEVVRAGYGDHPVGAAWVPASMRGSAPTLQEAAAIDAAKNRETKDHE